MKCPNDNHPCVDSVCRGNGECMYPTPPKQAQSRNELFKRLKISAYERAENYKDCYAPNGGMDFGDSDLNFLATYMADWACDLILAERKADREAMREAAKQLERLQFPQTKEWRDAILGDALKLLRDRLGEE